jgi:hypothetical protein
MNAVLTADNSTLLNQIGAEVCQVIVNIQKQHPEFLLEKYRNLPWESSRHQSGLTNKLIEVLSQAQNASIIQQNLHKFLKALFAPESFNSPLLIELFAKVAKLYEPKPVVNNEVVLPVETPENPNSVQPDTNVIIESSNIKDSDSQKLDNTGKPELNGVANPDIKLTEKVASTNNNYSAQSTITVLLLDAENLQINTEAEKLLATICNSPIQVKVAFANWCRKGKLDVELHERGYELIHVPAGKDNADGKMITFGSVIHERFPNAKEVLVCSSDNVMTNLCNLLQQNGLNVYRVIKDSSTLTVFNNQSGEKSEHIILPTIEHFYQQIKEIIKEEETRNSNQWIKLSKISQIFYQKYKIGIKQVTSHYMPGKTAKDIFIDKSEFVIHHLPEDTETYIALFKLPQLNNKV